MLDQRRKRWADVVQMLYKCFVFAGYRMALCYAYFYKCQHQIVWEAIHFDLDNNYQKIIERFRLLYQNVINTKSTESVTYSST